MGTDLKDKKDIEEAIAKSQQKITLFDRLKSFFSKMFGAIGDFFRGLFAKQPEEEIKSRRNGVIAPPENTDKQDAELTEERAEELLNEIDEKENEIETEKNEEKTMTNELPAPPKRMQLNAPEDTIEKETPAITVIELGAPELSKEERLSNEIHQIIETVAERYLTGDSSIEEKEFDGHKIKVVPAMYEPAYEEYDFTPHIYLDEIPLIKLTSRCDSPYHTTVENEGICETQEDAIKKTIGVVYGNEVLEQKGVNIEVTKPPELQETIEIQENTTNNILINTKKELYDAVQQIDGRITDVIINPKNIYIEFALEDDSVVLVSIDEKSNVDTLDKATKESIPTPKIGFYNTLSQIKDIVNQNENLVNKIYTSNEVERREIENMIAEKTIVKVKDIEELKDAIVAELNDPNRNRIVYDAQERILEIKMPEKDARLTINLVNMKPQLAQDDFDAQFRMITKMTDIDVRTLDAKYRMAYEIVKANKEFFHKDLHIDKFAKNKGNKNIADEVLDEHEESHMHKKDTTRKQYNQARKDKQGHIAEEVVEDDEPETLADKGRKNRYQNNRDFDER